jgi:hypothetical protein
MNKSDSIKNIADAIAKAQAEMPFVQMNSVNPFLKNKVADLGAVISTIKPVLASHGLSYSQPTFSENGSVGVTTIIMHTSGEWLESSIALPVSEEKGKSAAQVAGSIITYLRRYSLTSAFGLYSDEDTDGHTGTKVTGNNDNGKSKQRVWTIEQKQAVVKANFASNEHEAKAMLDHSILPANAKPVTIVSWAKHYRVARDEGKEVVEAAQIANSAYTNAKKEVA